MLSAARDHQDGPNDQDVTCVLCRLPETWCLCWRIQQQIRATGGAHLHTTPRERGPKTIQAREVYYRAHSMDKPGGGFLAPIKCGHARDLYPSQPQTIRPAVGVPAAGALNVHPQRAGGQSLVCRRQRIRAERLCRLDVATDHRQRREAVYLGGLITRKSLVRIQPLLPISPSTLATNSSPRRRLRCQLDAGNGGEQFASEPERARGSFK